jgi:hypothetical protein
VKLFVAFHVIAITSWSLPNSSPAIASGKVAPSTVSDWILYKNDILLKPSVIKPYVLATGFWQSWDMFSPNPANEDIYADAEVFYKDGSVKHYQYPRMYELPLAEKYAKERYRKFFEHANTDEALWPYFAQRIADLNYNEKNPPVKVALHRHWYDIPRILTFSEYCDRAWAGISHGKFTSDVLLPDNPPVPTTYHDYVYYQYPIVNIGKGK